MSVRQEIAEERFEKVSVNWSKLKQQTWQQLLLRFAFGAGIAIVASLAGDLVGQRFGGLFLAFPAILPAALTMVERQEGEGKAEVDAMGASLGGLAMIGFAVVVKTLMPRLGAPLAEAAGWIVWLALALGLFLLVRGILQIMRDRRDQDRR
ncbi:MAG: DUF3147 family protein [Candidatus Dormibacter sp.]|uniref:DUF3147 family protein n=1 Tax=Candidatus Dormibacter sp. TaxID=2973982 RepID=UPI000DB5CE8E|nr:MAG: hypothetical protein DLM66_03465 [Candidatus Dormibacteraeota bacterium]